MSFMISIPHLIIEYLPRTTNELLKSVQGFHVDELIYKFFCYSGCIVMIMENIFILCFIVFLLVKIYEFIYRSIAWIILLTIIILIVSSYMKINYRFKDSIYNYMSYGFQLMINFVESINSTAN